MNRLLKILLILLGFVAAVALYIYDPMPKEYTAWRHAAILKKIDALENGPLAQAMQAEIQNFKNADAEVQKVVGGGLTPEEEAALPDEFWVNFKNVIEKQNHIHKMQAELKRQVVALIDENYTIPWYIQLASKVSPSSHNTLLFRELANHYYRLLSELQDGWFSVKDRGLQSGLYFNKIASDYPELQSYTEKIKSTNPTEKNFMDWLSEQLTVSRTLKDQQGNARVVVSDIGSITPEQYATIMSKIIEFLDGVIAKLQQEPEQNKEVWQQAVAPYIQEFKNIKASIKNIDDIQKLTYPELWYRDRVEKRVLRYLGL